MRFLIHTPINVHGKMMGILKNNQEIMETAVEDKVIFCSPHDLLTEEEFDEDWMKKAVQKNILSEITLVPAPEYACMSDDERKLIFSDLAGKYNEKHPIRNEMKVLTDSQGRLCPVAVVPLVMIYNSATVDEKDLTHSWADLFLDKYKVMMPFRDKPMTRGAGAFLLENFPEQFEEFEKHVCYDGYPMDGIKAVLSGECDMAMTIYSLATIGESRGVKINQTKEGYIMLPLLLAWKNDVNENAEVVADVLMDSEFQEFLSEQGAWPVHPQVSVPECMKYDGCLKNWKGWDAYFRTVKAFDHFKVKEKEEKICS